MNNRKSFAARAHFYFSLFMIVLYVVIGLLLIFVLKFLQIQPANRIAAGGVLIVYAGYRTYKLIRDTGENRDLTNHENESA